MEENKVSDFERGIKPENNTATIAVAIISNIIKTPPINIPIHFPTRLWHSLVVCCFQLYSFPVPVHFY